MAADPVHRIGIRVPAETIYRAIATADSII
jgi:hypothetical protein